MIKLKTAYYITTDDVEELTGIRWDLFEFAQMAENDSYQILNCSDWYLEELYEEYEDTKDELEGFAEDDWGFKHCYPNRIMNNIKLIEILRKDYGCRDTVLIWISW